MKMLVFLKALHLVANMEIISSDCVWSSDFYLKTAKKIIALKIII